MTGWSRTGMQNENYWMNGRRFTGTIWSWSSTAARWPGGLANHHRRRDADGGRSADDLLPLPWPSLLGPHFVSNRIADWGLMPFRVRRVIYAGYVRRVREARRWLLETTGISEDLA